MGIQLTGRREDTDIVLTDEIADKLRVHLPRRYRLAPEMALLYSLDQHGISLSTLYRLVKNNKGPCVLVIKDADNNVFGAYLNESLKPGTRYYGTGECEGVFGLWINSELEKGYSQSCPTFDNERLTPRPEFECIELEIWGFRI
ncbi:hypothetical protein RMCBS344292_07831 [Rhizopus microsporus]|nr:hypothetical protein RMCBS344292_07831 [Rhizopus microsporus]